MHRSRRGRSVTPVAIVVVVLLLSGSCGSDDGPSASRASGDSTDLERTLRRGEWVHEQGCWAAERFDSVGDAISDAGDVGRTTTTLPRGATDPSAVDGLLDLEEQGWDAVNWIDFAGRSGIYIMDDRCNVVCEGPYELLDASADEATLSVGELECSQDSDGVLLEGDVELTEAHLEIARRNTLEIDPGTRIRSFELYDPSREPALTERFEEVGDAIDGA